MNRVVFSSPPFRRLCSNYDSQQDVFMHLSNRHLLPLFLQSLQAVFNYDFDSLNKNTPVIQVGCPRSWEGLRESRPARTACLSARAAVLLKRLHSDRVVNSLPVPLTPRLCTRRSRRHGHRAITETRRACSPSPHNLLPP